MGLKMSLQARMALCQSDSRYNAHFISIAFLIELKGEDIE
jgi:hypothetical protein